MKTSRLLALAAVLCAGVSVPALADYDKIGNIDVSSQQDKDGTSPNFGGPVERLQFTARSSDIACKYIRVTYRDGHTTELFNGTLRQDSPRNFDLPGTSQDIRMVQTSCHADRRSGGRIEIAADIGHYRDTWRQSPDWSRMWSRAFNWASNATSSVVNYNDPNSWAPITTVRFQGKGDTAASAAGWGGRNITEIGLKPLNADAACGWIRVSFADGRVTKLDSTKKLLRGGIARFDLPGNTRTVSAVKLACHAVGGGALTIQVYGNK